MEYNDEFEENIESELIGSYSERSNFDTFDLIDESYMVSLENPWENEEELGILFDGFDDEQTIEVKSISEELLDIFDENESFFEDVDIEELNEEVEIDSEAEENICDFIDIDYDAIYESIQQESLELGFEDIDIEYDMARLDNVLEDFSATNWSTSCLSEQKNAIESLANYVSDSIGFRTIPTICYYYNEKEGEYGGYDPIDNSLNINEYMLYDSKEAADTVVHELWHAYQHERAEMPQCARDYQYQFNFENYIGPELGQEAYENQLIEAEARAFAAQFKDRLAWYEGKNE